MGEAKASVSSAPKWFCTKDRVASMPILCWRILARLSLSFCTPIWNGVAPSTTVTVLRMCGLRTTTLFSSSAFSRSCLANSSTARSRSVSAEFADGVVSSLNLAHVSAPGCSSASWLWISSSRNRCNGSWCAAMVARAGACPLVAGSNRHRGQLSVRRDPSNGQ